MHPHEPISFERFDERTMVARSAEFLAEVRRRRTVRAFAPEAPPRAVIENCLLAAGTAPSGANQQPWRFVVVSDPATKRAIREAAEAEERQFYSGRAPAAWLGALAPLGTGPEKPFLEQAPYLIAIFAQQHGVDAEGQVVKHYYVQESVGIATGILITALHHAGLATLTYTPSPMAFLNRLLDRPTYERPFLLLVTGYPDPAARLPHLEKKRLEEIAVFVEGKSEP